MLAREGHLAPAIYSGAAKHAMEVTR